MLAPLNAGTAQNKPRAPKAQARFTNKSDKARIYAVGQLILSPKA